MLQLKNTHVLEAGDVVQNMHTNETVTIEQTGPASDVIRPGEQIDPNDWVVLKSPSLGI